MNKVVIADHFYHDATAWCRENIASVRSIGWDFWICSDNGTILFMINNDLKAIEFKLIFGVLTCTK